MYIALINSISLSIERKAENAAAHINITNKLLKGTKYIHKNKGCHTFPGDIFPSLNVVLIVGSSDCICISLDFPTVRLFKSLSFIRDFEVMVFL
jgi:hypothetical protein